KGYFQGGTDMTVSNSRLSGFYQNTVEERIRKIAERVGLNEVEISSIESGEGLTVAKADHMIENVIGTFSLPFGVATNFVINNRDYLIPMVDEDPWVDAADSDMGKMSRDYGGFRTSYSGSFLMPQI